MAVATPELINELIYELDPTALEPIAVFEAPPGSSQPLHIVVSPATILWTETGPEYVGINIPLVDWVRRDTDIRLRAAFGA